MICCVAGAVSNLPGPVSGDPLTSSDRLEVSGDGRDAHPQRCTFPLLHLHTAFVAVHRV